MVSKQKLDITLATDGLVTYNVNFLNEIRGLLMYNSLSEDIKLNYSLPIDNYGSINVTNDTIFPNDIVTKSSSNTMRTTYASAIDLNLPFTNLKNASEIYQKIIDTFKPVYLKNDRQRINVTDLDFLKKTFDENDEQTMDIDKLIKIFTNVQSITAHNQNTNLVPIIYCQTLN